MSRLGQFFKNLVGAGGNEFIDNTSLTIMVQYITLMAAAVIFSLPIIDTVKKLAGKWRVSYFAVNAAGTLTNAILLVMSSIMLVTSTVHPFLYFRF